MAKEPYEHKVVQRLLSKPKNFTVNELMKAMKLLGFDLKEGAGTRIAFVRDNIKIKIHKPHPQPIIKTHQMVFIVNEIKRNGLVGPYSEDHNVNGRFRQSSVENRTIS